MYYQLIDNINTIIIIHYDSYQMKQDNNMPSCIPNHNNTSITSNFEDKKLICRKTKKYTKTLYILNLSMSLYRNSSVILPNNDTPWDKYIYYNIL